MPVRLKDSPKVHRTRLQYASWLGNTSSLLIVVDNDMYIKRSPYEETDHRITNTGQPELIYNGIPDWLYQGKILQLSSMLWGFGKLKANLIKMHQFHRVLWKDPRHSLNSIAVSRRPPCSCHLVRVYWRWNYRDGGGEFHLFASSSSSTESTVSPRIVSLFRSINESTKTREHVQSTA